MGGGVVVVAGALVHAGGEIFAPGTCWWAARACWQAPENIIALEGQPSTAEIHNTSQKTCPRTLHSVVASCCLQPSKVRGSIPHSVLPDDCARVASHCAGWTAPGQAKKGEMGGGGGGGAGEEADRKAQTNVV